MDLQSFQSLALPALAMQAGSRRRGTGRTRSKDEDGSTGDCTPVASPCQSADTCISTGVGGRLDEGSGAVSKGLTVIDEVGKMELFSQDFVERVRQLFDADTPGVGVVLLVTIPVSRPNQKQHWLLQSIRHRRDCKLYEVVQKL